LKGKFALSAVTAAFAIIAIISCSSARADAITEWNQNAQQGQAKRPHHGWSNIGPGAPGVSAKVAVDPGGSGTIYVGSIGGGVRKSTDNGVNWSTVNSGLNGTAVYSLAIDALAPNTIYAGVFTPLPPGTTDLAHAGGVFKSTDGGANWALLTSTAETIPLSLTADPGTSGVVFMGGLGGFIIWTKDGGTNWKRVFSGTSPVTSIVIDPFDSYTGYYTVYASTLSGLLLLETADMGASWKVTSISTLPPKALWGVAMDPTDDHILYVATNTDGVWRGRRSLDGSFAWQPTGPLPAVPFSLTIDPSSPQTIFVATTEGVWESADGGDSWQQSALKDRRAASITMGPRRVLYAGTTSGPAISEDLGLTWKDPDPTEGGAQAFSYSITVDPNSGYKLFVSTLGSTPRISDDRGMDWVAVGKDFAATEARRIAVDPTDSNRVYAGSFYAGLFKSTDGGETWSRVSNFGSGSVYAWIPAVDPVFPNVVYLGTSGEGLFKSTDSGEHWTQVLGYDTCAQVSGYPRLVQGITIDQRNHNEVWFATSAGILRSQDGGATYCNVLPQAAWSITIVGGDSPVVYATTKLAGVYRSLDGGDTWQAINVGITTNTTNPSTCPRNPFDPNCQMGRAAPVIIDPEHSEVLYVGSEGGGGVFKSTDGGDTWFPVNLGLSDTSVFGLAADPRLPRLLYVSGPHGIFATATGGE